MTRAANPPQPKLRRSLGALQLILYGLGTTVGAGIYALVGEIVATAGLLAPWSFLTAAALATMTAISFAVLSRRYPRAAGIALYIQMGFGYRRVAMVAGCATALAGIVSSAALLNGFVGYLQHFATIERSAAIALSGIIVGGIACWGISQAVWTAALITLVEIGGLLWISVLCLHADPSPPLDLVGAVPMSWPALSTILAGALLAFYAYIGFEDLVEVAEEVKEVRRVLPLAILATLALSTALYILLVVSALNAVGPELLANSRAPLADLYQHLTGAAATPITAISLFAIINGALIQLLMASRILYGLASRHQLPRVLARVNATTQTPVRATVLVTTVTIALALAGRLGSLAQITSVLILALFAAVNAALWRIESNAEPRPGRRWIMANALIGFTVCTMMVVRALVVAT